MESVVSFEHVYKRYRKGMRRVADVCGFLLARPSADDFWALQDVSFAIGRGESFGIIGGNGAGKSTLLKILAGVTRPNRGQVAVAGRLGPLLELGAGLNPRLTGRENIFLYGAIHGMSRAEIRRKFAEIVDFSGLEAFLDTPLKHYSSGMSLRLGFAVAIHTDPDILLVDEVLAVGDGAFQLKCLKRIDQFHASGRTLLLVSHSPHLVRHYTGRCLWLEDGAVRGAGPSQEVVADYLQAIDERDAMAGVADLRAGTCPAESVAIVGVRCLDGEGRPGGSFAPQAELKIEIAYRAERPLADVMLGLAILREGVYLFGSKARLDVAPAEVGREKTVVLRFPRHPFLHGHYSVTVGLCRGNKWHDPYCYHRDLLSFAVEPAGESLRYDGWILTDHAWEDEAGDPCPPHP